MYLEEKIATKRFGSISSVVSEEPFNYYYEKSAR